MPTSRMLSKGDEVYVGAETHNRAVSLDQRGGVEVVTVAYAYPAGDLGRRRMAGTVIGFTDGHEQVYNTNSEWIMA